MADVSSLVSQVASRLGIDPRTANQAVGKVLSFIQGQLGDSQFSQVLGSISGAEAMAQQSDAAPASGGMLGGLTQMAGSLLGGDAGDSLELAGTLKGLGLDQAQIANLAATVADVVQQHVGDSALATIKEKIPALSGLLGG